jgi:hypothetical protein
MPYERSERRDNAEVGLPNLAYGHNWIARHRSLIHSFLYTPDREQLSLVFRNVVQNALHFSV